MVPDWVDKILDVAVGKMSKQEFLAQSGFSGDNYEAVCLKMLDQAVLNRDRGLLDSISVICWTFGFTEELVDRWSELVTLDWHGRHEDITMMLQDYGKPKHLDILYKTATRDIHYLVHDRDSIAYKVNCIWAIWKIGGERAEAYLAELAQHSSESVSEAAIDRLNRIEWLKNREQIKRDRRPG